MVLALGAGAAVRTVDLGTLYSGSLPAGLGSGPLFTVTFEDGEDASVAGGVDVTLKAVGLDAGATVAASGWWFNFDSPANLRVGDLALSYKVEGDYRLGSYRLLEDGVSGAGSGYGNFDIGVTFDVEASRFTQGDSLRMTFVADGVGLSNSDFFGYETSTEAGSKPLATAVRLARYLNGEEGGVTHATSTASGADGVGFGGGGLGGGAVSMDLATCEGFVEDYETGGFPDYNGPGSPMTTQQFLDLYYNFYECPEPSSVFAGCAVALMGATGWYRRRRRV